MGTHFFNPRIGDNLCLPGKLSRILEKKVGMLSLCIPGAMPTLPNSGQDYVLSPMEMP